MESRGRAVGFYIRLYDAELPLCRAASFEASEGRKSSTLPSPAGNDTHCAAQFLRPLPCGEWPGGSSFCPDRPTPGAPCAGYVRQRLAIEGLHAVRS